MMYSHLFFRVNEARSGGAKREKRWLYIRWTDSHLFSHGCEKRGTKWKRGTK
jgi:hypothetical protein